MIMALKFSSNFDYLTYFSDCVSFLAEFSWIFQHSNTKFVQAGVLDRLPAEWIRDFRSASNETLNQIPQGFIDDSWCAEFKRFLHSVSRLKLEFDQYCLNERGETILPRGVSPKKQYEIDHLTALIREVCTQDEVLLDFGSGLGYLSQNLNSKHKFEVLGIEADESRVESSVERQKKWFAQSLGKVKYIRHFINEDSFNVFKNVADSTSNFAIVGLHACADLSVTAIKMFLSQDSITKLVIMPCCYHKLKPQNELCTEFVNIPVSNELSEILATVENFLNRPFLRLGCQQTSARWRNMTAAQHEQHGKAMFERSLVEAVIDENHFVTSNKDKSERSDETILGSFVLHHRETPKINHSWSSEHHEKLTVLRDKYPDGHSLSEYLTCLQLCLQSICENLILLDRMCFIESEAAKSGISVRRNLIRFSNDYLSPRCFTIVAEKIPNR